MQHENTLKTILCAVDINFVQFKTFMCAADIALVQFGSQRKKIEKNRRTKGKKWKKIGAQ